MIIKNTPRNARFIRRVRETINAEIGFKAVIDRDWNCGADVRIEIATVDMPFTVMSSIDNGVFHVNVKMQPVELDDIGLVDLKWQLYGLNEMTFRLWELVHELKPEV